MANIKEIYNPTHMEKVDIPMLRLRDNFENLYNVDIDPDFQRGHVWTLGQQESYVGYIIQGGPLLPLVINSGTKRGGINSDPNHYKTELVDGKQRYTSIVKWIDDEIHALLYSGERVKRSDIEDSSLTKTILSIGIFIPVGMVKLSREEVLKYYIKLNSGGSVHTSEEIDKVRKLLENEQL